MPKLGIISQVMSGGGGEQFLYGLLGGMLHVDQFANWDVTVLLPLRTTANRPITWPEHLKTSRLRLEFLDEQVLWDDPIVQTLHYLRSSPDRILDIPGTSLLRQYMPELVDRYGPSRLRHSHDRDRIELLCHDLRLDVLYCPWPHDSRFPKVSIPVVVTVHDLAFKHGFTPACSWTRLDEEMREWLDKCARFVAVSQAVLDEIRSYYSDFAAKGRVIREAPADRSAPTLADWEKYRRDVGLPAEFILSVGWVTPHKNQKVLFQALGQLKQQGLEIPLVCVGPNSSLLLSQEAATDDFYGDEIHDYVNEVLDVAQSFGLEAGRDFLSLGYVSDTEVEYLYRLAKIFVMPTWYEGHGLPVIEAAGAGCPVICSNIPALVEEVGELGGNALLFDPADPSSLADAIKQALLRPTETRRLADRAAALVRVAFDWKTTAAAYLELFEAVSTRTPAGLRQGHRESHHSVRNPGAGS